MRYKAKNGKEYTLVEREVILRGGKIAKIFYFVGQEVIEQKKLERKPLREAKALPEGYEIVEVSRSGGHPLEQKIKREKK